MPSGRLRVGQCVVDVASREVHAPGAKRPLRLAPKSLAVLLTLARQPGQVVTREQLLAEVWPDTLPTNDVVTQAVTQLRKAFASHNGQRSEHIETIAKTGYRLMAAVVWEAHATAAATLSGEAPGSDALGAAQPDAGVAAVTDQSDAATPPLHTAPGQPVSPVAAEPAASTPAASRHRRSLALAVASVALLVVLSLAVWTSWRRAPAPSTEQAHAVLGSPKRPYQVITAGGGFDLTPSLSPDGARVAYASLTRDRAGTSILVKTTDNAYPRVLETPAPGVSDRLPAWSPDGRQIAFSRQAPDGGCRVMIAAADGPAASREVMRCDGADMLSFSWSPDGRALVFGSMTGPHGAARMRRLDLATGQWQTLDYPAQAGDFDYAPRYSPDGNWIVFLRNPQLGDLWRIPAEGGVAERLTHDNADIRGWSWLPDGSGLIFGRRVDSEARLYLLDLRDHSLQDVGVDDAQAPDVANGHLVFVQRKPQFGVYQVIGDTMNGGYIRRRLFPSSGRDDQPMIAPDGRQLIFASNRSGAYGLWWGDVSKPGSVRLIEGLRPDSRQAADWSADSQRVLVSGSDAAGHAALFEVNPGSGQVVRLPVPQPRPLQAIHLPDPDRLLVLAAAADGHTFATLYDRRSRPWRALATLQDVSQLRLDRVSGQVLLTRLSGGGVWQVAPSLAADTLHAVDPQRPSRWRYRSWAPGAHGQLHYLSSTDSCAAYDSELRSGRSQCLDAVKFTTINGFSLNQHDGTLYVSLAEEDGSAIAYMPLPQHSVAPVGVVANLLSVLKKIAS
ncbi:biopolymer transporter Tol [Xanthomonas phaseoli pv. phaseoli]|uniref:Periplasmic component of the Tol biopolymer transport system n=2 Tax=Xanthomonas TaxID=338 RepID=A0AB38DX98_XANCH|nr:MULTISPECIES: winged helix-turn-helix domain-containing protein [Xanthomonas]ATS22395.1 PD40 domain-containing protein [Xanthomonas phaseoli pv. phaseoli]ATS25302.1 PD40 domain-containing protein [Xanthomonas phaseoli pv. phaseoli]ATS31179.1 PD40 domain-containing protein [Xanthomonas phaseoli pv. phaseoli]ATS33552.1 PD40 domain-containing protein [Xanthomonas phaseoli pv. phaseoli]AZU14485.1 biopolymer transporter Tol [Xanthomonas phaseoli pv. phaseoli]